MTDAFTYTGTIDSYHALIDWAGRENVSDNVKTWDDPGNPEALFAEIDVRVREGFRAVWIGDTLTRADDGEIDLVMGPRDT